MPDLITKDDNAVVQYELEEHLVTITTKTLIILFDKIEYQDALVLYFFYIKSAKIQHSTRVWAGSHFIMQGLRWGNKRFCSAKKILKDLNLIEDVIEKDEKKIIKKYYIKVKFVWNPVMLKPSDAETQSLATGTQMQDDYKNNNIIQDEQVNNTIVEKKKDEAKQDSLATFLDAFNRLWGTHYKPREGGRKDKLNVRLQNFTMEQILTALENMATYSHYHGDNDRKWVADPDFLIRNDEQVEKFLQKGPLITEKTEFLTLTDLEVWEIAGQLDVPVSVVKSKMMEILNLATTGEIKKYSYAKNTRDTLVRWITAARDAGRINRMDEMDKLEYPTLHPEAIAKHNALVTQAKKDGII